MLVWIIWLFGIFLELFVISKLMIIVKIIFHDLRSKIFECKIIIFMINLDHVWYCYASMREEEGMKFRVKKIFKFDIFKLNINKQYKLGGK